MKQTLLFALAAAALCILPACSSSNTSTVAAETGEIFMPVSVGEKYIITLKNEAGAGTESAGKLGAWKTGAFEVAEIKSASWVKLVPVDKKGETQDEDTAGFWINMNQVASVKPVE